MMWTMPWRVIELVVIFETEKFGVLGEIGDLRRAFRIGIGLAAVGRRHVVIDDEQRLFRRAHFAAGEAQAFESLRRRHFMHEMTIDVEQAGAVRLLINQMIVPDFVVESCAVSCR